MFIYVFNFDIITGNYREATKILKGKQLFYSNDKQSIVIKNFTDKK